MQVIAIFVNLPEELSFIGVENVDTTLVEVIIELSMELFVSLLYELEEEEFSFLGMAKFYSEWSWF